VGLRLGSDRLDLRDELADHDPMNSAAMTHSAPHRFTLS
jgi:hypothetical protein